MSALRVEGLSAGYGGPPVLRDVSFEAEPGETVCVLGPNGGGKTTLFRVLLGELEPQAGRVGRPRPPGLRSSDRAHPARLPRVGARRRADGDARARALVAAAARRRPERRRRRARARRARRPGGHALRRALGRPAPAGAARARARAGRSPAAARRAAVRGRPGERRVDRRRIRRAARRGPHAARLEPRRRERPHVRPRPLPARPPGGLRPAGRGARPEHARGHLRQRDDRARRGRRQAAP